MLGVAPSPWIYVHKYYHGLHCDAASAGSPAELQVDALPSTENLKLPCKLPCW